MMIFDSGLLFWANLHITEKTWYLQIPGTFSIKFDGTRPRLPSINSPSKNPSYTKIKHTHIWLFATIQASSLPRVLSSCL